MQTILIKNWQAHLKQARYRWETRYQRDPGALLRGQPLAEALAQLEHHPDEIDARDRNFIEASLSVANQEAAAKQAQWEYLIETLVTCAQQKFTQGQELEALLEIIRVARLIKAKQQVEPVDTYIQMYVITTLRKILDTIREYNRLSHDPNLSAMAISPDGHRLATTSASQAPVIKLWTQAGVAITTLSGHRAKINALAFSPDGQSLASVSSDCTVKLWSLEETEAITFKVDHPDIDNLQFTPNGEILAAFASGDHRIYLWHLIDQETTPTLIENDTAIQQICFSPNRQIIAATTDDHLIKLWHLDGMPLLPLKGYEVASSLAFSPDGQILAAAGLDHTINLWQIELSLLSREPVELATLTGHCAPVRCLKFSPDHQTLASGSEDCTLKLWNLDGSLKATLTGRQTPDLSDIIFSPDGQYLSTTPWREPPKLWKLPRFNRTRKSQICLGPARTLHQKPGHWHIRFDIDSQIQGLIYQARDHIELWQPEVVQTPTLGHQGDRIHSIAVSPNGQYIAAAAADQTVKICDHTGTAVMTLASHTRAVRQVSFSPDGQTLVSADQDNLVKVWKFDGTEVATLTPHRGPINRVCFSADGQQVISASDDGTVKLYPIEFMLAGIKPTTLEVCRHGVTCVACSQDGTRLVTGDYEGYLKFWQPDGTLRQTIRAHGDAVTHVAFTTDGQRIASSSYDHTIKIWRQDGQGVNTIRAHQDTVNTVVWHPTGRVLASTSQDGTIKLLAVDGRDVTAIQGGDGCTREGSTRRMAQPITLSFTPDGKTLIDASSGCKTRLWDLDLERLLQQGSTWLQPYLENNSTATETDKQHLNAIYPVLSRQSD